MENRIVFANLDNLKSSLLENIHIDIDIRSGCFDIAKTGDYLVTGGNNISFIDNSNPKYPHVVEKIVGEEKEYFSDLCIANEVLVARSTGDTIYFYNITDINNITEITSIIQDNSGIGIAIEQDFLYDIRDVGGFNIYNISNLNNITKINEYLDFGRLYSPIVDNDRLYAANICTGLNIFDIENPLDVHRINKAIENDYKCGVQVKDDYAYYACGQGGLEVYNIKHRNNPKRIWREQYSGFATDIALHNNFAYLTNGFNGLDIYDISQAENPTKINSIKLDGYTIDIEIKDSLCVTSQGENGITILNLATPNNPRILAKYTNGTMYVQRTTIGDQKLYLATVNNGLEILNIADKSSPTFEQTLSKNESVACATLVNNKLYFGTESGIKIFDSFLNIITELTHDSGPDGIVSEIAFYENRLLISYSSYHIYLLEPLSNTNYETFARTNEHSALKIVIYNDLLLTAEGYYSGSIYSLKESMFNLGIYFRLLVIVLPIFVVIVVLVIIAIFLKKKRNNQ